VKILRLGTRKSALALWQADFVRRELCLRHPGLAVEVVPMTTQGDRILDRPLAGAGGKGLFIKELEQALLANDIDLAVHSLKDLTVTLPAGLHIGAVCARADPRNALVANRYDRLDALPAGGRVATSSLRRACQLRAQYPALAVVPMRGNVDTRLKKLDAGECDALILAAAGLARLGFARRIRALLSIDQSLPAVGQGAMCIECRARDRATNMLVEPLDDPATRTCITAERALNFHLHGGCQLPIAGYAELVGGRLRLRGLVGEPDGKRVVRGEISGVPDEAETLGARLAADLLERGARQILDNVDGRA